MPGILRCLGYYTRKYVYTVGLVVRGLIYSLGDYRNYEIFKVI